MTVFVHDTFTDTAGTALASHTGETGATWTIHPSYGTSTAVISDANRARPAGTNINSIYYASGVPGGAEYDVEGALFVKDTTSAWWAAIIGRLSTSADTRYMLAHEKSANNWRLYKTVAGANTLLGSFAQTLSDETSYACKLEIRDAAKKVFIDGVERISSADNAIVAANRAGLYLYPGSVVAGSNTTAAHWDSITATDLTGGGSSVSADPGSYSLTGTAASLKKGWKLSADVGSYTQAGTAANLVKQWKITAAVGSYTLTGTAASLIVEGERLTAESGSYAVSGTTAALAKQWKVAVTAGGYVLSGTASVLSRDITISGESGSYALTGTNALLKKQWKVSGQPGAYTLTGTAAILGAETQVVGAGVVAAAQVYHPGAKASKVYFPGPKAAQVIQ